MTSSLAQPGAASNKSILTPIVNLKGHEPFTVYLPNDLDVPFQQKYNDVSSTCYFPDGKQMISGSGDKTARRWNLCAGKEIEEAREVCEQSIRAVGVSRDGRWVVMGGGYFEGRELKVCDVQTGIRRRFEGHSEEITCIDISADNTLLASGSMDCTARIWELDTGKLLAGPFKGDNIVTGVGAVRFSRDSKKLACHAPVFWTTKDKTTVAALDFNIVNHDTWTSEQRTIYELDALTPETVGTPFEGHTNGINGLALSFDCALLATASWDDTIKLW
ncbi:WD40 repeat-like protein, partial [Suillus weaverae]